MNAPMRPVKRPPGLVSDHWFPVRADAEHFAERERRQARVAIVLPLPGYEGWWHVVVVR